MSDLSRPDRRAIESSQVAQLRALLGVLRYGNRFYGPRLVSAGLDEDVASLSQFRARMPTTKKAELIADQRDHPPYGTNLTFALERYTRFSQTSATTTLPLRWLDTTESWTWMLDNWAQVFRASGVGPSDRVLFAFSFGPFLGFWTAFEAASRLGCLTIASGGMTSAMRLQAIVENGVTVLCCTPTYAIRLGEVAGQQNIDLRAARVKAIIVAGEPGGSVPATRDIIEQSWPGAVVYDHHGMTEVGPVSFQCPACPGILHVIESAFAAEVIETGSSDPGKPVEPGQSGELILTTLGRTAAPLLRYRTGDIVRCATKQPCRCGHNEMALEGGIIGRVDDMVLVRGVNIFPSAVDQIIRAAGGVAEYRAEVSTSKGLTELNIQIEVESTCQDQVVLCARLEQDFRNAFQLRVPVSTVSAGELPRYEMKAKRWIKRAV